MAAYAVAAYVAVAACLLACAAYAVAATLSARRRRGSPETAEEFITARSSVGSGLLAFSFYASAMGSWVTTAPAAYAASAGLLGLASYALAAGAPLLAAAWAGSLARAADQEASSLPDFLRRRFAGRGCEGRLAALLAVGVMMLNMVVALLAEYATLGILFRSYVGSSQAVAALFVVLMAVLTIAYTMLGGLMVSILTDRVQAISALALTAVLAAYLFVWLGSPTRLPALTRHQAGWTVSGYSSLLTMPVSLLSSTLFSEAIWQRVWASDSSKSLQRASCMGCVAVSTVVFFFGFMGFLALWDGTAKVGTTNSNLYFFAFLSSEDGGASLDSVFGLLALLCAALMSEGAADSLQNGITATLSSTLLKGRPLWATRALVLLVNVPLAALGASPLVTSVLQLFLLANLVCVCCALPLLAALLHSPRAQELVTEAAMLGGCAGGWAGLTAYGWLREGSLGAGARMAWFGNSYAYDYFLAAILSSALCLAAGCALKARANGRLQACDGQNSTSESSSDSLARTYLAM